MEHLCLEVQNKISKKKNLNFLLTLLFSFVSYLESSCENI